MKTLELEGSMILNTGDPFEADPIVIGGQFEADPLYFGLKSVEGGECLHDAIRKAFELDDGTNRGIAELGNCRIKIEWDE